MCHLHGRPSALLFRPTGRILCISLACLTFPSQRSHTRTHTIYILRIGFGPVSTWYCTYVLSYDVLSVVSVDFNFASGTVLYYAVLQCDLAYNSHDVNISDVFPVAAGDKYSYFWQNSAHVELWFARNQLSLQNTQASSVSVETASIIYTALFFSIPGDHRGRCRLSFSRELRGWNFGPPSCGVLA